MKIKFKKLHPNAVIPQKAYSTDGARDLVATAVEQESVNSFIVKVGFAIQFPPGYRFRVCLRSSGTKYNWVLINSPAIGDCSYTGEYFFRFKGIPVNIRREMSASRLVYDPFPYKVGDRFAQCYFEKVIDEDWEPVEELNVTSRGSGGYGSTGTSQTTGEN